MFTFFNKLAIENKGNYAGFYHPEINIIIQIVTRLIQRPLILLTFMNVNTKGMHNTIGPTFDLNIFYLQHENNFSIT